MNFLNAALLGGLGAISVPILIHLLNRRRYRILRWAAMDFLLDAQRRNKRRVQVEHLLVLLLRCAAVALIVLAVARPVATRGALAKLPGARDQVERVVVLDDSASTSEREGDRTAFDEEKRLLVELLEDLARERPGDLVTVVRGSRPRQPDLVRSEAKSGRTEELGRRIPGWSPSHARFPVVDSINAAFAGDGGKTERGGALKRYVYVLTDQRRTDWQPESVSDANAIVEALKNGGKDTRTYLVDAGHDDRSNLGVAGVLPQEKIVATGIPQKLVAQVRNHGQSPVREVRLGLTVGASVIPVAPVSEIRAGETKDVEITYTFAEAGPFAATVSLEGDRMPADDVRDVALEVVRAVRVLLVDGRPSDIPGESQAFFLENALTPPGEVKSGVEAVTVPAERLGEEDLSSYHAVILCGLDRWPKARVGSLERYVKEGGGLAVFLSDDVDAAAYDKDLWKEGAGVLPCRLGELSAVEAQAPKLTVPALDHPLLRLFSGENNPFLSRIKTRRYFSLPVDGIRDRTTAVIARWENVGNTPAIVEKRPFAREGGKGRALVFNTSASRAWTEWPTQPSFPVFAQELVRHLAPASTEGANLQVGEPIQRAINPAVFEPKARLFVPGEKTPHELLAARRPDDSSDSLWFSYPGTQTAGIYRLELVPRAAGASPRLEHFAVEVDAREGDLEKADPAALARMLDGLGVTFASARETHSLLSLTEGERRELWRTCAFLLLAVLAAEGVLSFIAAHHGSSASAEEVEAARRRAAPAADAAPVKMPTVGSAP